MLVSLLANLANGINHHFITSLFLASLLANSFIQHITVY